jgi:hypothetical protein
MEFACTDHGERIEGRVEKHSQRNGASAPTELRVGRLEGNADGEPRPSAQKKDQKRGGENTPAVEYPRFFRSLI